MKKKENKEKPLKEKKELDVVKIKEKKSSHETLKKVLSKTSYTMIVLAIIIAAYIAINLLVEKLNITDIDLTSDKIYSLSETSKQIVRNIDQEVEILLINMDDIQSVIDFSNRYSKENDKIKVTLITDVTQYPELTKKYSLTQNSYMIIIRSGNKEKQLTTDDLYTYDYTTYQQKDLTEEAMTNALLDVTVTEKPKIYFLAGHNDGLSSYMYAFKTHLAEEANEVEDLDLLIKGKVPEDCSTLAITTLNDDLKGAERDAILDYIKKGGKIILFTDANVTKIPMPNFQKVLDEYGISISEGILIEQDANRMLSGFPEAIIVTVNQGTSVTKSINMETSACFINSGKINIKDSETLEKLGVTLETLATTSSKAFYRTNLNLQTTSKQKEDEEGEATVGALLTKKIDDNTTSKLIVYSNNMFVTSVPVAVNVNAYQLYNNEDLALNSISYLTGRDDTIMIRKDIEVSTYTVTESQQNIVLVIIFAVPIVIVIAGIVVWQVRRRKK